MKFPKEPALPQPTDSYLVRLVVRLTELFRAIYHDLPTSGTYTPTLSNTTNVAASTAYQCHWLRVGNVIHVSGKVDIDPTSAVATLLGISLPVASDFTSSEQCSGTAFCGNVAGQGAMIYADTTNNRASLAYVASSTANQPMYFTFTYRVV